MSREHVEAVRRGVEAWNRGDLDGWLEVMDPDVELTPVIAQLVEGGDAAYHGVSGARRFWQDWRIDWDFQFADLDLRDADDDVVMIAQASVTSQSSGLDLDTPMGAVCTLRNGLLIRMTSYLDPAEALEAVGLRE
jgi:ketosteroid isomerase-like protein